jgi:hypothetical protein
VNARLGIAVCAAAVVFATSTASQGAGARGRARAKPAEVESPVRHEPVTEQQANTPIPVYAELTLDAEHVKARVHYRAGGRGAWRSVRMEEVGDGYGAEIPCRAVKKPGTLEYYVRFKDDEGTTIALSGSREQPYLVEVTADELEDPPHFPGERPPRRCSRAVAERVELEEGEESARAPAKPAPVGSPSVWLGFGLAQDAALFGGDDVCSRQCQLERGFACFRGNGTQYHGTPERRAAGTVDPGVALAATRVYLASEVRLSNTINLGLRVGYAIAGRGLTPDGGKAYFPMHAELRGQYWFSSAVFPQTFAPFVLVSGGVAQVDASKSVAVVEDRSVAPPPGQLDNPDTQSLDAYKKMGLSFAAFGAGAYFPVGASHGIVSDLKAMLLFPDVGAAFELELGYAFGL